MSHSRRPPLGELYPVGEDEVRARLVGLRTGIRVRIVEAGPADGAAIVLVPGWGCGAWIFHDTLPCLAAAGFRAIAVELKGHGFSDKPRTPDEYTVEEMRDHLLDIVDALNLPRVGLVGHSMGGSIVAHVAAARPERVAGLVLVGPVGFAGVRGMTLFRALTPRFMIPVLPYLARRFVIRAMLSIVYGKLRRPSPRDADEFWAPTQFPDFTRALRHLLHRFRWNDPFPTLAVPWMTILGSQDLLSPPDDAALYTGTNGSAPVVTVEGGGHVLFTEAPGKVGPTMVEFFEGLI